MEQQDAVDPNWAISLLITWSLLWRAMLVSIPINLALIIIFSVISVIAEKSFGLIPSDSGFVLLTIGWIVVGGVSTYAIAGKWMLKSGVGGYRLVVIKR